MLSCAKKISNEMITLEGNSAKFIAPSDLYTVKITFGNSTPSIEDIKKIATEELNSTPEPSAVYYNDVEIILMFSYVVENYYLLDAPQELFTHQLEGNHHDIISKYVSKIISSYGNALNITQVNAKIIEFNTQNQAVIYLGWVIFEHSQKMLIKLSKNKIKEDLLQFRTQSELKEMLYDLSGVKWDSVAKSSRYGTILKIKKKKGKLSEFSDLFDAREHKKMISFIFD